MFLINWICQVLPVPHWLIPPAISMLLAGIFFLLWKQQGVTRAASLTIYLTVLLFGIIDWLLLAGLPYFGLSFGPIESSWVILILLLAIFYLAMTVFVRFLTRANRKTFNQDVGLSLAALWLINLVMVAGIIDSMYIEPFNLKISIISLPTPSFLQDRPLRIIQLSDIHVERITKREQQLITIVNELQPDLILLTGDYVNIDYNQDTLAQSETRDVLSQLHAKYGTFAVSGSPMVDTPTAIRAIFDRSDIHLLRDEIISIELDENTLYLVGVSNLEHERDQNTLILLTSQLNPADYVIFLYHVPDPEMANVAMENGIDLFLAGHTHGGQIRLPLIGSPVRYFGGWPGEYEIGEYDLESTILYVNRGVGMEGLSMPRMRFNVPPEIALFELGP